MNPIRAINTQHIDKLIDIYLDALVSVSNDAGWTGESMMARLIEFEGEVPLPTRNDQSNLAMIRAIELLRHEHAELPMVRAIISKMLKTYLESNKILALLAKHYYVGLVPGTDRPYANRDRMRRIGRAPVGLPDDIDEAEKKWETAERYYRRDCQDAYRILSERLSMGDAA